MATKVLEYEIDCFMELNSRLANNFCNDYFGMICQSENIGREGKVDDDTGRRIKDGLDRPCPFRARRLTI
jgi:hypothetical protein